MIELNKLETKGKDRPPRIVLYGSGGIGKSTFASQAPNPIFFDIEDGLEGIEGARHKIKTWQEALDLITALHEQEHDFQTVVVDSIDWLETLAQRQVCVEQNVKGIEDIGYGKGYVFTVDLIQHFLDGLDSLREQKDMGIILLAHDQIVKVESPITDSYDMHTIKLHKKCAAKVVEWADAVLFATKKVYTKTEKNGFKESKKGIDGGRVIYTVDHPAYQAKHRANLALPDEIEMSWESFISNIGQRETKGE